MSVAIASTCYWETDPPTFVEVPEGSGWSGRLDDLRGAVFLGRNPGEDEYFEAQLFRDSLLSARSEPEMVYRGPALEEAVRRLNERLDALEAEGYVKSPRNDLPKRLNPTKVSSVEMDRTREMIAEHLSRQPPEPPQPEVAYARPAELADVERLFTLPRGSLYLATYRGRPSFYVDEDLMVDYVPPHSRETLPDGTAKVFSFERSEDRWTYITHYGWDRLNDDYLRSEMRRLYDLAAHDRGTEEGFEDAYRDAKKAIEALPCAQCRQILWPVVRKPEHGSAEWWADPSPYFACRQCGKFLADAWTYPMIRQPTDEFPFEQVMPQAEHES